MPHFREHIGPSEKPRPLFDEAQPLPIAPDSNAAYAELTCFTNFSFLRGASHSSELVARAKELGLHALAITDLHTLAGIVRAHETAKELGIKLLVGTRVEPRDCPPLCLYAMNRQGYARLCRLLTLGKRRAAKGACELYLKDISGFSADLQAVVMPNPLESAAALEPLKAIFGERLSLGVSHHLEPAHGQRLQTLLQLARDSAIAPVAVNDVYMHCAQRKPLHDVLTSIRHLTSVQQAAGLLFPNAERRLKSAAEMLALLPGLDAAIARSVAVANACTFSLDELRYEYPDEVTQDGLSKKVYLRRETWRGASERYGKSIPEKVSALIEHELALIEELEYESYFLTIYDIILFARGRGILCQGRGSAANSAVCFCLGITSADPDKYDLLFERFISRERKEPPDIDVDFEHERREEVLQYIYEKYGRDRAGICATVICYRTKSALRDAGKALGLSLDQVDRLSKARQWFDGETFNEDRVREAGIDPRDPNVRLALKLAGELRGFPRHLSQHVGGMVMTRGRLDELVPIENAAMADRTVIEWDKDDIDTLGILKVDCLSLGMLTALRKSFVMIEKHGGPKLNMHSVLSSDVEGKGQSAVARPVYAMLQKADSLGTFQVESRAQMSMLPRLAPREFFDLVVEVAIVRPGPIQGGMVHPYLRRRRGEEPVEYPHPRLKPALERTLGVPLFQEQCMRLAVDAAGFTPGEADQLRKAMGGWRRPGLIESYRQKLVQGMLARGITEEYAERVYKQIAGFGEYGFPMSHAISFALITYVSCHLKRYFPAAFTASLVNSQPMGFYSSSSLVRDAREHGVDVRPVDVNASHWDCTLECDSGAGYLPVTADAAPNDWGKQGPALRLGLRLVAGLRRAAADAIVAQRVAQGLFASPDDFVRRMRDTSSARRDEWVALANAGAFDSLGLGRREALWDFLGSRQLAPGFLADAVSPAVEVQLPALEDHESMALDYATTGLSLNAHPLQFLRESLTKAGVITARQLAETKHGKQVKVAGWVLVRQRPGQGKMLFYTLEDETGIANLMMLPRVFEANRKAGLSPAPVVAHGKVERDGDVIHVKVNKMQLASEITNQPDPEITTPSRDFH